MMQHLKLMIFILNVLVFALVSMSNAAKTCRTCAKRHNTRCISTSCEYKLNNKTAINKLQSKTETLFPPELHCQDEGLLVLTWDVADDTSYFVQYSNSEEDHNFTNLTTNGFEILEGLQSRTDYLIQLTSLKIINFSIHIERSPATFIRTLRSGRPPLPVEEVYVDSLILVSDTYTAVVKWRPGADKSCFYNIVWFGGEEFGSYTQKEIEDPLNLHELNVTDLQFGQNYSLSIRAIREGADNLSESPELWLNIVVPTCLQTYQSLTDCVPEAPENLKVEEIILGKSHTGFPHYDIKMFWSKPKYTPDFYIAVLDNQIEHINMQLNITGNQTSAEFVNIELDTFYQLSLQAYSVKGPGPPVHLGRIVNSTAAYLSNEPLISIEIILLIATPFIVIGLALMFAFNHFVIKKARPQYFKNLDEKNLPTVNYIVSTNISEPDEWELLPDKLIIKDMLGEGAFGVVRKGYYSSENGSSTEVAIKMLKSSPTQDELKQFYQEIDIMKSVPSHPHLVSLIGCITQGTKHGPLLVVEFCSRGDLQTYLRNAWTRLTNRLNKEKINFTSSVGSNEFAANMLYDFNIEEEKDIPQPKDLLSYARQIALGMEYLSSLKLIHRDLATRNILICKNNTVKISDFGLSRDVYHNKVYCKTTGGKLPLRWMALESMTHQVYTTQSDIWSFGILLWEIVTLGSTPYPGISSADLLPLLKSGYRMEKPSNCSNELYTIMYKCWRATPRERPTFSELRKTLDDLLESVSNYLNLNTKETADITICRKNNMNKYKNVNFSEGYVIQMKSV